ncbi:hypothetical protein Tco_1079359 [Tanacetum coccineum]|uniref:Uncharacterized protein n=1 Tax=Tanacetum coccineum TaxID=301880 RepID=A0ABQ5HSG9_9ASTR
MLQLGIEFVSSFVGEVGYGNDIRFWIVKWVGEVKLCDRFPRLYSKECRVRDKGNWIDNTWCWEWDWVRNLRGRVCKDFEELQVLLQNVVIKLDCRDRWRVPFVRVRVGVGSHSRFCSNWSASGLFQVQGLIGGLGLLYKDCGMIQVCKGTAVMLVSPTDGTEEIANPFMQPDGA